MESVYINLSLTITVDGGDKNTGQHQQQRNSRALVILRWQRVLHHPSFRRMVGTAVDVAFHTVLYTGTFMYVAVDIM